VDFVFDQAVRETAIKSFGRDAARQSQLRELLLRSYRATKQHCISRRFPLAVSCQFEGKPIEVRIEDKVRDKCLSSQFDEPIQQLVRSLPRETNVILVYGGSTRIEYTKRVLDQQLKKARYTGTVEYISDNFDVRVALQSPSGLVAYGAAVISKTQYRSVQHHKILPRR
jgi:hypothetical protein